MPQSFACLQIHLIFSTKNRAPLLLGDLPVRLFAYIGGILRNENGALLSAGGMPDHVHLLVSLSRESSVSVILREIKSSSSR
jgi:REP element-mobilizing transposase RayT